MAILDFLKRKKDIAPETLSELGIETNDAGLPESRVQAEAAHEPFKPAFPNEPTTSSAEMQLVNTKLDLINQRLENIDRRLQNIEQLAKEK